MVSYLEKYKPKLHFLHQYLLKPIEGILKCSTDGASRGNPGRITYWFNIRNSIGDLIYAQREEIQEGTYLAAQAILIREALAHCITKGNAQAHLETNSQVLIKFLTRVWKVHWNLAVIIDDIWGFSQDCQVWIQHLNREGNTFADY